jgi:hypothetical protein
VELQPLNGPLSNHLTHGHSVHHKSLTDAKAGLRGEKPATNRPELLHDLSRISQHLSGESELKKRPNEPAGLRP